VQPFFYRDGHRVFFGYVKKNKKKIFQLQTALQSCWAINHEQDKVFDPLFIGNLARRVPELDKGCGIKFVCSLK